MKGTKLLAAALAMTGLAGVEAQPAAQPSAAARAAWGLDRTDLTPHPDVRLGVLPNGMRYALMRSAVPPGRLSVRLRIDAGSAAEGERQQGFMHLIEHLIFEGSANLPQGALALMLPRYGLERWSDFRAYTIFDETVYQLDLAQAGAASRQTALTVMREISSNLLFDRKQVAGATRMVTAEIDARDAVQDRIAAAKNAFFVPGTPIARGSVAGSRASVGRAGGAALRRLYGRTYVPRAATLVLVGDFDMAAAAAEIAASFSDWQGQPGAAVEPATGQIANDRGAQARLFVDKDAPTEVTIAVARPLAGVADAAGPRDAQFLEHLAHQMLTRRLSRIAARLNAPFAAGSAAGYDHFATARLAQVEISARNGDWRGALAVASYELRNALAQGFKQSEFEEQMAAGEPAMRSAAVPPTSSALADAIIDAVGRRIVFTAPADPEAGRLYLQRVRLADVNEAFRTAWAGSGWLIFVSHDRRIASFQADVTQALAASREASR